MILPGPQVRGGASLSYGCTPAPAQSHSRHPGAHFLLSRRRREKGAVTHSVPTTCAIHVWKEFRLLIFVYVQKGASAKVSSRDPRAWRHFLRTCYYDCGDNDGGGLGVLVCISISTGPSAVVPTVMKLPEIQWMRWEILCSSIKVKGIRIAHASLPLCSLPWKNAHQLPRLETINPGSLTVPRNSLWTPMMFFLISSGGRVDSQRNPEWTVVAASCCFVDFTRNSECELPEIRSSDAGPPSGHDHTQLESITAHHLQLGHFSSIPSVGFSVPRWCLLPSPRGLGRRVTLLLSVPPVSSASPGEAAHAPRSVLRLIVDLCRLTVENTPAHGKLL
ncbi:uncharacterized protein LOC107181176 [Panthera tigris]|uniref:uncharacterized protein LOC107181176 n=1 Tax=Panthera tigris TaxID=9694 RepID=UPI001C6F5EFE|nr:uncharacterized protein LOC107181176 [Panthera tigris]